jgi:lipopolysaccharide transport system ATP-binding protein
MLGSDPTQCPIHVTRVELLDESGEPRAVYDHGERMVIRLHYRCRERLANPNFNVSLIRSDNVACCNFNTAMDGFCTSSAGNEGIIELVTPRLKLVSEMYSLCLLVWDADYQKLHSVQEGPSFHVRHETLNTEFGVFHENGEWRWVRGA